MQCITRREIIALWETNNKYCDYFTCPDCRDILTRRENSLVCDNVNCENRNIYNLDGMDKLN